jgi:hypothetical protein
MRSQHGRRRGLKVRLGYGPSSKASLRVKAMMPPLAVASTVAPGFATIVLPHQDIDPPVGRDGLADHLGHLSAVQRVGRHAMGHPAGLP